MTTPVRWRLEGRLTTRSPLHIGSGEPTVRRELMVEIDQHTTRPAEISAVALDHAGRAYLPGSAIKGSLRSWISEHVPGSEELVGGFFGDEDTRPLEERRKTGTVSRGGKAEFWDARQSEAPDLPHPPPHWDADRATGVRAFVTLDRRTKTVAEQRLFHEEFVPAGVTFDLVIAGQGLNDEEVDLLLAALACGFDETSPVPLALGAGTANGDGQFDFEPTTLRRLGPEDLADWLAEPKNAGYEGFPEVADLPARIAAARQRWVPVFADRLRLGLELPFHSPFAVGSADRAPADERILAEDENRKGARLPACDELGQPVIPGSSIRGALRSQGEKILRTLGVKACDPGSSTACRPVKKRADVDDLCPACRLFGAAGWGTAVDVTDFRLVGQAPTSHRQEHLAIDRFTGGVAGPRKFKSQSFTPARLAGSITLDRKRAAEMPWAEGLLALVLRDLIEGDVPLGHGAARGFGAVRAQVTDPPDGLAAFEADRAAFRAQLDELRTKHPLPAAAVELKPLLLEAAPLPAPPAKRPKPGESEFHNPYHFVPLPSGKHQDREALPVAGFDRGETGAVTHDRYVPGTFSGRITFQVKTETPTVLGAKQHRPNEQSPATIDPFKLDGEPAIPGSSLRGLLSSLVEAVTGSALRVLEDTSYSVRCLMDQNLPYLGRMVADGAELKLEPLALPHLPSGPAAIDSRWRRLFPNGPVLKSYVEGYVPDGPGVRIRPHSFIARRSPRSASSSGTDTWYLRLGALPRWGGGPQPPVVVPRPHIRHGWLLSQDALDTEGPITAAELATKPASLQAEYFPGLLRVLDITGHEKEIPTGRKHEIFIPTPPRPPGAKPFLLDIEGPLADFHRLAAERAAAEKYLPFALKGAPRINGKDVTLRAGDLVWFKVDDAGRVTRLALSSIWRQGKETAFAYFADRPELRPFHPGRKVIDAAERLFGFVEEGDLGDRAARALASRLRVANARLDAAASGADSRYVCADPCLLAILGSPKPPAPALYFRQASGKAIRKRELRPKGHLPQGRKFFLHQRIADRNGEPWWHRGAPDSKDRLRVQVRPLRPGLVFEGHLDFDNLTERELALLVYALRPTPEFRHKLGLGKPLGLGTVEITPLRLETVDRQQRYEADELAAPRHAGKTIDFDVLRGRLRAELEPALRDALELLGDPAAVVAPVHYPQTLEQRNAQEEEHFRWFVRNDSDTHPQALAPIAATEVRERALPRLNLGPVAAPPPAAPAQPDLPGPNAPTSPGFATLAGPLMNLKLPKP